MPPPACKIKLFTRLFFPTDIGEVLKALAYTWTIQQSDSVGETPTGATETVALPLSISSWIESASCAFRTMVGMAGRAVPGRVVAGRTNIRVTVACEGVAPLHAARTSQRDVPSAPEKALGWSGGSPLPRGGEPFGIEP